MPSIPRIIMSDFAGLTRVCGPGVALRWLSCIARTLGACRRTGTLQPADAAMGEGPFAARRGRATARLTGPQVISGIREIWVRDVYLGGGYLSIRDGDTVVDLGCNMGNFTLLALGHGPSVRVVSVEADQKNIPLLERSLAANGWVDRPMIVKAFVGGTTRYQFELQAAIGGGAGVPHLTTDEFLARAGLDAPGARVGFLKCDIEGSEFGLLRPASPLLAITDQLALEVHKDVGSTESMCDVLRAEGFEVRVSRVSAPADILLARRMPGNAEPARSGAKPQL